MRNFDFALSTRVIFGRDTHKEAGKVLKEYGFRKILLYYGGGSIKKTGVYDAVVASLKEAGIEWIEQGGVRPNPTVSFCRETVKLLKAEPVDCILAVGGGSVLDSAKMAAHAAALGKDPWYLLRNPKEITGSIPIGSVLTIAAAGSETSDSAVLTDEESGMKRGCASPFNRPLFAIMDPTLTYTLPPYQTASGVVDIMMHTLERYFCHNEDNALTDGLCEGLLRAVIAAGARAMEHPEDYEARATIMWAGSLSHNGLMGTGREYRTLDAHQLEHELSARKPEIVHGAGLAVVWPAYLRFIAPHCMPRMLAYAERIWDVAVDYEHPERSAEEGIRRTRAYFDSLGMPGSLEELGLTEADIEPMAELCWHHGERIIQSYVPFYKEDIMAMYRSCLTR